MPSPVVRRRLVPGAVILARETGVLQVGLDAPRRALLPDLGTVRRLLDALVSGTAVRVEDGPAAHALSDLQRAGLLVSATAMAGPALLARHGDDAPVRERARAAARVGLDVAPSLRPQATHLVAAAGLVVARAGEPPDVVLVAADRALSRERVDRWVRDAVPHLVVEARDGGLVLGPLVVPGATACLRCVDAHLGEQDPHRPLVLERAAARSEASPLDALTVELVLAWAVRDVRLLVEGDHPATWSSTLAVDVAGAEPGLVPRAWSRHPSCGCAWDSWPARSEAG